MDQNNKYYLKITCINDVVIICDETEGLTFEQLQSLFLTYYNKCANNKGLIQFTSDHTARVISVDKIIAMELYNESGFNKKEE